MRKWQSISTVVLLLLMLLVTAIPLIGVHAQDPAPETDGATALLTACESAGFSADQCNTLLSTLGESSGDFFASCDAAGLTPSECGQVLDALFGDSTVLSMEDIMASIAGLFPDAVVISMELSFENGAWVWEAKLLDGTEVKLDATTGDVVVDDSADDTSDDSIDDSSDDSSDDTVDDSSDDSSDDSVDDSADDSSDDNEDDDAQEIPAEVSPVISPDDASAVALEVYPNSTVVKIEFQFEDGTLIWSVTLSNGVTIDVDAETGLRVSVSSFGGDHNEDSSFDSNHQDDHNDVHDSGHDDNHEDDHGDSGHDD